MRDDAQQQQGATVEDDSGQVDLAFAERASDSSGTRGVLTHPRRRLSLVWEPSVEEPGDVQCEICESSCRKLIPTLAKPTLAQMSVSVFWPSFFF